MTLTPLFFIALMAVENPQNVDTIGRAGERGPLQITPVVVRDVNRIHGTTFTLDDCFDYDTSVEIARLYLEHWCARKPGKPATAVDAARIWNGGPRGYEKYSTVAYGIKFHRRYREVVKRSEAGESNTDPAEINVAVE